MSFVYAFKADDSIYMIGDTKVSIGERNNKENFKGIRRSVEEYGTLKTIILSDDIALGFVGNDLGLVSDALQKIFESDMNLAEIVDVLRKYSFRGENAPSFILTYKNEKIYLIENGGVGERENCYIGSRIVFEELQKRRNNRPINSEILTLIRFLLKDDIDDTVGGFCTQLKFIRNENKYQYLKTLDSTVTKPRMIPTGATLPLVDNAEDGGFTYATFTVLINGSSQYLAIHITQINKTYVYMPMINFSYSNSKFKYLFFPCDIPDCV